MRKLASNLPLQDMIRSVIQDATEKLAEEAKTTNKSDKTHATDKTGKSSPTDKTEKTVKTAATDPEYVEKLASAVDYIAANAHLIEAPQQGIISQTIEKMASEEKNGAKGVSLVNMIRRAAEEGKKAVPSIPSVIKKEAESLSKSPQGAGKGDTALALNEKPTAGKQKYKKDKPATEDAAASEAGAKLTTGGLPGGSTQLENNMGTPPGGANYPEKGPLVNLGKHASVRDFYIAAVTDDMEKDAKEWDTKEVHHRFFAPQGEVEREGQRSGRKWGARVGIPTGFIGGAAGGATAATVLAQHRFTKGLKSLGARAGTGAAVGSGPKVTIPLAALGTILGAGVGASVGSHGGRAVGGSIGRGLAVAKGEKTKTADLRGPAGLISRGGAKVVELATKNPNAAKAIGGGALAAGTAAAASDDHKLRNALLAGGAGAGAMYGGARGMEALREAHPLAAARAAMGKAASVRDSILQKLAGEDVMKANISAARTANPLAGMGQLESADAEKDLPRQAGGPTGGYGNQGRSHIQSNQAAINMTKKDGKGPQKTQLKDVLDEPALSSRTDSKLNENLRNTGKAGVKIAAARAYLQKIASEGCQCDGQGDCQFCKLAEATSGKTSTTGKTVKTAAMASGGQPPAAMGAAPAGGGMTGMAEGDESAADGCTCGHMGECRVCKLKAALQAANGSEKDSAFGDDPQNQMGQSSY